MTMTRQTRSWSTRVRLEALPDHGRDRQVRAGGTGFGNEEPRASGVPRAGREPSPPRLPRNLGGVTVLVVDDDDTTLEFLATALRYCGARVTTALAAAEALTSLAQARPDVVLSDIAMPEQDGYWLIREIRSLPDPALSAVPVVATTAYGHEHSRDKTLAAGFIGHLSKPIDPDALCRAIASAMGRD
jgi:CheY-like chemotaxis protein